MFVHIGVPATRAGIPTARHASTNKIDSPLHVATPLAMLSKALWSGFFRLVEYLTFTIPKSF
jgi:hypothetical protein